VRPSVDWTNLRDLWKDRLVKQKSKAAAAVDLRSFGSSTNKLKYFNPDNENDTENQFAASALLTNIIHNADLYL